MASCNESIPIGNLSVYWNYPLGAMMSVTTVVSSLENILLLAVLHRNKELHSPSYKILSSLVIANLVTGLVIAPLHAIQFFDVNKLLNICKINLIRRAFSAIFLSASFFTVGFMALNACLRLIYLQRHKMPKRKLYSGIALCWLVPFILPAVVLVRVSETTYSQLVVIFGTIVELIFVISFLGVYIALKIHTRRSSNKTLTAHRERILGRTVFMIIIYSITMVTPLMVYHFLNYFKAFDTVILTKIYNIVLPLAIINSAVNPMIYFRREREVKKTIRKMLNMSDNGKQWTPAMTRSSRKQNEFFIMDQSNENLTRIGNKD